MIDKSPEIMYPKLNSNKVSFKLGWYFVDWIFSTVQRLFQVLKSTAVGIHPIRGIIKNSASFFNEKYSEKLIPLSTGPLKIQSIKAITVENNNTRPMTFIN